MTPRFLTDAPPVLLFTGKGGVGKTSLACATAVRLADAGRRVCLVSTDPASNVGQVFGVALDSTPRPVPGVPGLDAAEIDPMRAAAGYRERIVGPVRGVLPDAVVAGIEEQLSGACTVEVAAFDEFTGLLTDPAVRDRYDHILFDTAPTGHTLRLLALPGAWSDFLTAGRGDASCLGPLAGLDKQRERYAEAVAALTDPATTRVVLVTRAQERALGELARTAAELHEAGMNAGHVVVNGVMPDPGADGDAVERAVHAREQRALSTMPVAVAGMQRDALPLKPFDMVGIDHLRALWDDAGAPAPEPADDAAEPPTDHAGLHDLVDELTREDRGLVMVMGKGGVGKTTLAAAIAVALADRGHDVHLSTSDPAAHLADTLDGAHPRLTVGRIDPRAETARYREQVLRAKGDGLDAEGRALLEEDLRSPCTEEIAVFQAFSREVAMAGDRFVVMDTAPTGHTLLLLDATGAYHRDTVRQSGDDAVTPLATLRDPDRTRVIIATLAETTPVLEATRLEEDLRRSGIAPWAWVVNQSIAASRPRSALLRARAANEAAPLAAVTGEPGRRVAVVPLQAEEPVGVDRLRQLAEPAAMAAGA